MPVMEPNLDAATLQAWARVIDGGPFSSLCWGERIAFDNPECLTLLGALAAWTDRVRLVTTVVVPQLHDPVMLAKALATGDMLSGGRLTVGLGVGGRHEDYHAVGADPATQTMRGMAERCRGDEANLGGGEGDRVRRSRRAATGTARGAATAGRHDGAEDRAQRGRRGQTDWRARRSTSTSTNRTNCSTSLARHGRRPASPIHTWPRRSGSRWETATRRGHRSTGICFAT